MLEHLYALVDEEFAHADSVLGGPRGVRINAQSLLGRGVPDYPHDLHVAIGSELDLENRILARLRNTALQLVTLGDRDREARLRRCRSVESP